MAEKSAMGANPVPMGSDAYLGGLAMETAAPRSIRSMVSFAPETSEFGPDNTNEVVATVEIVGASSMEKCALLYVMGVDARLWPTKDIPEGNTTLLFNGFAEAEKNRNVKGADAERAMLVHILEWANAFVALDFTAGYASYFKAPKEDQVKATWIKRENSLALWAARNEFLEQYGPRAKDESEPKSGSGFVIGGIFLLLLALAALAYLTLR